MIQDAINQLASLQTMYFGTFSIEVMPNANINFFYQEDPDSDETIHQEFRNAIEMTEWMEDNLIKL